MSSLRLIGFAEESNVIFICTPDYIFMAHIESPQFSHKLAIFGPIQASELLVPSFIGVRT
jgi:hypothetical protein